MLFHTWHFLIFFIVVYAGYILLKNSRFYLHWLLVASYFFYGWWNPLYLLLIFFCTLANYYAVVMLSRSSRKKLWLSCGIMLSLLSLGFFKYAGFVTENVNRLLAFLNLSVSISAPSILLPVGISFFTFQAMSYTIDFYRGNVEKEPSFLRFATFVSFFPQLVAGPIERSSNLIPQLSEKRPRIFSQDISDGLSMFFVGLFKKVALADYLALYVDKVYAAPLLFDGFSLLVATFAFGWQIYFDFSGYTDMARGIAKTMGINLMLNFNNPYLATGLGDFWNRWHISLSTWFKDYVYIPLGGNRREKFATYKNMFITMVVSGLWHGAAWTFVIWGTLHAFGRVLTRELERTNWYREKVPLLVKRLSVFAFVTFTWIYFRAESLTDANLIVKKIFTTAWENPDFPFFAFFFCFAVWIYQFIYESRFRKILEWAPLKAAIMLFILFYLLIFNTSGNESFIYFQF